MKHLPERQELKRQHSERDPRCQLTVKRTLTSEAVMHLTCLAPAPSSYRYGDGED